MRRNLMARAATLSVMLTLLTMSVASAQVAEPRPTEPPPSFKGVQTAVVTSALTDPAINEIIDTAAARAHQAIKGTKKRFWTGLLPAPHNVATAARDLAELEYDIVLTHGGDSQTTVGAAGRYPNTVFLDIGQSQPCVTVDGIPDPSGTCAGGGRAIPFNYAGVRFAVDEAGYLAGVIAAAASRNDRLGVISGQPDCEECDLYVEGFTQGARSVKPGIEITSTYLADGDMETAFGDPATGKTFAEAFINVYRPDVLFPVAGASSSGMIEAACDAGILAIGSDLDVSAQYPGLADCILASATKDFAMAVRESIFNVTRETWTSEWVLDLDDGGVAVTEEWRQTPGLPVDLPTRYQAAYDGIRSGFIETCPSCSPAAVEPAPTASGDAAGTDGSAEASPDSEGDAESS